MASSWGTSWLTSWLESWGAADSEPEVPDEFICEMNFQMLQGDPALQMLQGNMSLQILQGSMAAEMDCH